MKLHMIYEKSADGRIWSFFAELNGIVGNGMTMAEARSSLLESFAIVREIGKELVYGNVIDVETYTVPA